MPDARYTPIWTTVGEGGATRWLDDGSLLIDIRDTPESATLYRTRVGGKIERIGSAPRPMAGFRVSRDLQRVLVITRDYRGDAWMSKVVGR